MNAGTLGLFRLRVALMNGVAAAGGYLLFPGPPELPRLAAAVGGVALLAAGGSALNQVQERDVDRLMVRTRLRPLPRGDMTAVQALFRGGGVSLAGFVLLATFSIPAACLGLAALAWYLGLYTPLKRRTSLALAIGALSGAIPPVIGWDVAGGSPGDFRIIVVAGLFILWQVPHFWLLQRRHRDDYRAAGIPLASFAAEEWAGPLVIRLWLIALLAATTLLPLCGIICPESVLFWSVMLVQIISLLRLRSLSSLTLYPALLTLLIARGA